MGCLEPVTSGTKARLGIVNGVIILLVRNLYVSCSSNWVASWVSNSTEGQYFSQTIEGPSFHFGCYIGQAFNTISISDSVVLLFVLDP